MNENEMNSMEKQLRSWQPRRPAAMLKHRIFGISNSLRAMRIIGPVAPAAVCMLLTLVIANSGSGSRHFHNSPVLSMVLSNPIYAAYESPASRKGENDWSAVIFDWTSHSSLTSSIAPFSR